MEVGWPIGGPQLTSNERPFLLQNLKAMKVSKLSIQNYKKVLNFGRCSLFGDSLNLECFLVQ